MSEENLPEDNDLNVESGAELNDKVEETATDEQEVIIEDAGEVTVESEDTDESVESTPDEATSEEDESDAVVSDDEGSEESKETSSEEPIVTGNEEALPDTPVAAEGGIMAAAVAAAAVDTEAVVEEPKKEAPVDDGKRWYSLRVISGKERKIKERIELEIQRNNWGTAVTQVLVPSEKVYKIRSGKKVILERNILPGYILIEALYKKFSSDIVQGIANIPNVIHFLGKTKPIPMQQSEANRMLGKVDESQEVGEALIEPFIVGETVKIIDGPFNGFVGDIKEVNEEKKKLKVIVKIFGRGTEVELNFMQVDKES